MKLRWFFLREARFPDEKFWADDGSPIVPKGKTPFSQGTTSKDYKVKDDPDEVVQFTLDYAAHGIKEKWVDDAAYKHDLALRFEPNGQVTLQGKRKQIIKAVLDLDPDEDLTSVGKWQPASKGFI